MKVKRLLLFGSLLFAFIIGSAFSNVMAAPNDKGFAQGGGISGGCFPLDIIFIIDQSSSMSGEYSGYPNDPLENRTYAPQWVIDWMIDNAISHCPDAIHRLAVISFGTDAEMDFSLYEIGPDNPDEGDVIKETLVPKITSEDLGQTDPFEAFQLAIDMIKNAGAPPGQTTRKRAIIFITDGEPCTREELNCYPGLPYKMSDIVAYAEDMQKYIDEHLSFDDTLLEQERCLQSVRDEELAEIQHYSDPLPVDVQENINRKNAACLDDYRVDPIVYDGSTYIWTILLRKGGAWPQALQNIYRGISESHGGKLIALMQNRQEIPTAFFEILSQLNGIKATRLSCGNFAMNPYLETATITFFKYSSDIPVKLEYVDASDELHSIENGVSTSGFDAEFNARGANETYVFKNPYPEIWRLSSDDCAKINAYYIPVEMDTSEQFHPLTIKIPNGESYTPDAIPSDQAVEKYDGATAANPGPKYYLQFEVKDQQGNVIPNAEKDFFGMDFTVNVSHEEAGQFDYEMEWLPAEALFQSADPLILPFQGEYTVTISGDTVHRDPPYGPLDTASYADAFPATRHLLDYETTFNVACPLLDHVARCPWATSEDQTGCAVCPSKTFSLEILEPMPNAALGSVHHTILDGGWPLKVQDVNFKFQINFEDTGMFSFEDILDDEDQPASVTITPETGEVVDISYTREGNIYTGVATGLTTEGEYTLRVIFDSGYKTEFFDPRSIEDEVTFSRHDTFFYRSDSYYFMLAIVILAFILFVVYQILTTNNKLRGDLKFKAGATEIVTISLNSRKNWKKIDPKIFKGYPELDLAKLKAFSVRKTKTRSSDDQTFSSDMFATDEHQGQLRKVKVKGKRKEGGSDFELILEPNTPMDYSGNAIASMVYEPPE